MYQSSYKHHRIYATLLCLLTMNPIALGKQKSPTVAIMGNVQKEQPQTGNILLPTTVSEPMLTATQQLWLNETLKAQDSNLQQILETVLNSARSQDKVVASMAYTLLGEIAQEHPSLARRQIGSMIALVQNEPPDMMATMEILVIVSAVDPSACEQIFALLTNIFRTTDVRIHGQVEQIYAAEKSKSLIIDAM